MNTRRLAAIALAATLAAAAHAEITIGVSLGTTGPGSSLGIPYKNAFQLVPKTLGGEPVWSGSEPWKRVFVDVASGSTTIMLGDPRAPEWRGPSDMRRAAGWHVTEYQMRVETIWTTDSLVGFMRSTSFASRAALHGRAALFEADLRRELLELAPDDRFPASQRFGFTCATSRAAVE